MKKTTLGCAFALSTMITLGCGGRDDHASSHGSGTDHPAEHAHGPQGAASGEHAGMNHDEHEGHVAMAATRPASDTSLTQLTSAFTDQADRPFSFESLRGHPTLVVMFYGSCETVCPILLEDVRAIDAALAPEQRARLRVLLVTLDPERDSAERLRALAAEKQFDLERWSLLRGTESSIRELSMVLGVQYRRLPDGNFSHSALITLLDSEGSIAERIEGLRGPNAAVLARLRSAK